jgi:hypothetical protein
MILTKRVSLSGNLHVERPVNGFRHRDMGNML